MVFFLEDDSAQNNSSSVPIRKPNDGVFASYLAAPTAERIVRRLASTKVKPNHVTVASTAMWVIGAYLNAKAPKPYKLVGVSTLVVGFVLDCADGQLARLRGEQSTFGGFLDEASDRAAELFLIRSLAKSSGNQLVGDMAAVVLLTRHCLSRLEQTKIVALAGADPTKVGMVHRDLRSFSHLTIGDRLALVSVASLVSATVGVRSHLAVGLVGLARDIAARQVRETASPAVGAAVAVGLPALGAILAQRAPGNLPALAVIPYGFLAWKRLKSKQKLNNERL